MNEYNFCKQMALGSNQGGDGILKDFPLSLTSVVVASTGSPLTTASNPRMGVLETNAPVLLWAASDVTPGAISIPIPRDYDQQKDKLKLRLLAVTSAATVPTLSVAVYRKRTGVALSANLGPKAGDIPVAAAAALSSIVTVDLSSLSFQGGDTLILVITPAAHGTDTLNVYEMQLAYCSTIVTYNTADRDA